MRLTARISLAARRGVCRVAHHPWTSPALITQPGDGDPVYRTTCTRCRVTITGDWSSMEMLGAWAHYRRSF
jgi:hypothetical protein